jgi:uncharacterized membrane protein
MLAIAFYDVMIAAHVASIIIAFGVIFAYPAFVPYMVRTNPAAMPALHAVQARIGQRVIAPFGGLALLFGIYLASHAHVWSKVWVTVPLIILLALLASGGMFFSPLERRMQEMSERDLGEGRAGALSSEYMALYQRWRLAGTISCLLVLVAVFFMVAKPGG